MALRGSQANAVAILVYFRIFRQCGTIISTPISGTVCITNLGDNRVTDCEAFCALSKDSDQISILITIELTHASIEIMAVNTCTCASNSPRPQKSNSEVQLQRYPKNPKETPSPSFCPPSLFVVFATKSYISRCIQHATVNTIPQGKAFYQYVIHSPGSPSSTFANSLPITWDDSSDGCSSSYHMNESLSFGR